MESALSESLYLMGDDERVVREAFERKSARDFGLDEKWLQEAIETNPELVLGPCRGYELIEDEPWYVWQREYSMPGVGSIDVLLVSASGRVGIVETRWTTTRRSVVRSSPRRWNYLLALKTTDPEDLPALPLNSAPGRVRRSDDVERHLEDGDFLLIVAAIVSTPGSHA